ncbi:glycosyltransferase family 4 protein [Halosimplex marinum]|uniref:glycosyltransferase family 4 protein n=1 Tax=Halosimplex marinum TaxID=3396620 RepID=UPI003F56A52C
MDIVQVTPYLASPPGTGGARRIHGLVSGRQGDDELIRFSDGRCLQRYELDRLGDVERIDREGYVERRVCILPGTISRRVVSPAVQTVFSGYRTRLYANEELQRTLKGADLVVVEHPWQFDLVATHADRNTTVVYSSHNVEREYYDTLTERVFAEPLLRYIESLETRAAKKADLVVVTSERDGQHYRSQYGVETPIHVAPNATRIPESTAEPSSDSLPGGVSETDFVATFVGSDHRPNVDAVDALLEVVDRISADVQVVVAGTVGHAFEGDSTPPNVHLPGFVEDLDSLYAYTDLGMNPVTTGAGSNVKVPEYLAHGVPVLSTPFGVRGFPVEDGREALVRDLSQFPATINAASRGELDLSALARRGKRLVTQQLNWQRVSRTLLDRIRTEY